MKACYNSVNEKPLHFELPVFSNGLCLQQPLWTPSFLHKRIFFFFVLWICTWFTIRPLIQNCNSLLFLNKPILLEKYLALYLFKTNRISRLSKEDQFIIESTKDLNRTKRQIKGKFSLSLSWDVHLLLPSDIGALRPWMRIILPTFLTFHLADGIAYLSPHNHMSQFL